MDLEISKSIFNSVLGHLLLESGCIRGDAREKRPKHTKKKHKELLNLVMFNVFDPAGNSNVDELLRSTLCPVYATASSAESPSELSLRCLQM